MSIGGSKIKKKSWLLDCPRVHGKCKKKEGADPLIYTGQAEREMVLDQEVKMPAIFGQNSKKTDAAKGRISSSTNKWSSKKTYKSRVRTRDSGHRGSAMEIYA